MAQYLMNLQIQNLSKHYGNTPVFANVSLDVAPGEFVAIDMFFDDETTKFRLKFLGRENIRTKFGVVPTMIFRPLVQSGRVFKEEESLTIWISDDDNKLPIRIKASLAVGSLKADLEAFKGLKYPFTVITKAK